MSVLDEIVQATREECARLAEQPFPAVEHAPTDVAARLRRGPAEPLRLIAEIKHRSPSAGPLSRALGAGERARVYADAGATMISVLVDRKHFDGGYEQLAEARRATTLPLLAKGFAIDRVQIEAARRAGADAVLLIVRILDDARLQELVSACVQARLEPIVEVVDEVELARALATKARVIGVNARDLATLAMDGERARRVVSAIPRSHVSLWFSGVSSDEAVRDAAALPIDGALIGESLMRRDDPAPLLRSMVRAAAAR